MGVSVSPVGDCSVFPTTDEWPGPAKPRSDQPLPRIERAPSQARYTHLVATEADGRSILSSGPSRMASIVVVRLGTVCTM